MTHEEIWAILRHGGLTVAAAGTDATDTGPVLIGRYHGVLDPASTDKLGALLAEKARPTGANIVVVGEGANDLVLGFVVARELGLPLVRVLNLDGLVGAAGTLPERPKAVFVADRVHKKEFVTAVRNLLDREGGELAAVVSIVISNVPVPVTRLGLVPIESGLPKRN